MLAFVIINVVIFMSREEAKSVILDMMDFFDNGESDYEGIHSVGHPGFYFFHYKEEMLGELNKNLTKKEYSRFDIVYIVSKLLAFLLSKYDSHTSIRFLKEVYFPITFKMVGEDVYVLDCAKEIGNLRGAKVLSVNKVDIDKIKQEIIDRTCYSTDGYVKYSIKSILQSYKELKTLPSIDSKVKEIDYELLLNDEVKHIKLNTNSLEYDYNNAKPNYVYEVRDDTMILTYSSCKDFDKMKDFVREIGDVASDNNINKFIVDIRDNRGGNSEVIKPLLEFLEGKEIVTLVNETTFSAARMAFVDLRKLGSYSVGTRISTSLNCFGNNTRSKCYEDLGLSICGATKYFYYDKYLNRTTLTSKEDFESFFKGREELLEPFILEPDEIVEITLEDIKNGKDSQMDMAINYLNNSVKVIK